MSIFSNLSIYINGDVKNKQNLNKLVKDNGGSIAFMIGKNVTHMITTDTDFQQQSSNVKKASSYNIEILSESWVNDSVSNGKLEKIDSYKFTLLDKPKQPSLFDSPIKSPVPTSSPSVFSSIATTTSVSVPKALAKPTTAKKAAVPAVTAPVVPTTPTLVPATTTSSSFSFSSSLSPFGASAAAFKLSAVNIGKLFTVGSPEEPLFPLKYTVATEKTLQYSNISGNNSNNKFYHIELHSSPENNIFRLFTRYGRTDGKPTTEARYYNNLNDAQTHFNKIIIEKTSPSKGYEEVALLTSKMSSTSLEDSSSQESLSSSASYSSPSVQRLVESIFEEATKHLTTTLSVTITKRGIETPLGVLSIEQVEKGEGILDKIHTELKKPTQSHQVLESLSSQFYTAIPYKLGRTGVSAHVITNLHSLNDKVELLQLMKDLIKINGEGILAPSASYMKYLALKNEIVEISSSSSEYRNLMRDQLKSLPPGTQIENIFKLSKTNETSQYTNSITPSKLLFHGSRYQNFVGLLSRGMLLPKVIVNTGGSRSDFGFLGAGIYYADKFETSAIYAHPSVEDRTSRLMLISEVAIGKTKPFTAIDSTLTQAPLGFNSCLGVERTAFNNSDFQTNEYVIYNTNQQKQRYLVRFTLPTSSVPSAHPIAPKTGVTTSTPTTVPATTKSFSSAVTTSPVFPSTPSATSHFNNNNNNNSNIKSSFSSPSSTIQLDVVDDKEESKLRELFISNRHDSRLSDPFVHCLNVFDEQSSFNLSIGLPTNLMLNHDRDFYYSRNQNKIVKSLYDFQEKWSQFTNHLFDGFNWNNVFVAGGAVLGCALNNPRGFESSDIDIFLYGLSEAQAQQKLKDIFAHLKQKSPTTTIARTKYAITFLSEKPFRNVQVVLRIYKSPAEVLMGFDIDCCSIGYNGIKVVAIPRARDSIANGINKVSMSRRSPTYETRLFKYAKRGFAVLVPNFNRSDVPASIYTQDIKSSTGLQRLLLLEFQYTISNFSSHFSIGQDSDYSEVDIPWGPLWRTRQVATYLNYKDKSQFFASTRKPDSIHRHIVVVGETEVFSGKASWCKKCQSGSRADSQESVSGEIKWMTENPGKQTILTGSFHPVSDSDWYNLSSTSAIANTKDDILNNRDVNTSQLFTPKRGNYHSSKKEQFSKILESNHLVSIASCYGSERSLTSLLKNDHYKKFVNLPCENGYTPLHYACMSGSLPTVKILIENGALPRVLSINRYRVSCAMIAQHNNFQEIVDYLTSAFPYLWRLRSLVNGKRLLVHWRRQEPVFNPPTQCNAKTIQEAIRMGALNRVKELLDSTPSYALLDGISQSPLHLAVLSPNPKAMFDLVSTKCPPSSVQPNRYGQTVEYYVQAALSSIQAYHSYPYQFNSPKIREELKEILRQIKTTRPLSFSTLPISYRDIEISGSLTPSSTFGSEQPKQPTSNFGFGGKFAPSCKKPAIKTPVPSNTFTFTPPVPSNTFTFASPVPSNAFTPPVPSNTFTFAPPVPLVNQFESQPATYPTAFNSNPLYSGPIFSIPNIAPLQSQLPQNGSVQSIQGPLSTHLNYHLFVNIDDTQFKQSSLVSQCLTVAQQIRHIFTVEQSANIKKAILTCHMPTINSFESYFLHRNFESLLEDLTICLDLNTK